MSSIGPKSITPRRHRRGFTLVEILIVVVILGILASIVIPQFSNATETARQNTLKDELRYLRTQFVVYGAQHNDVAAKMKEKVWAQEKQKKRSIKTHKVKKMKTPK